MSTQKNIVTRAEFNDAYLSEIRQRKFVEYVEYYHLSEERFWQSFYRIQALPLTAQAKVIDIGGGIMGVLLSKLLGFDVTIADVNERARTDIEDIGLGFVAMDLFRDNDLSAEGMDLVVLQEVIEHIPQPPYIVFEKISHMLAPGGILFLTTPNGHRLRNIIYMLMGKEILDIYRYPEPGEALGHQHEYTLKQMQWQAEKSGLEILSAEYYQDGWLGSTRRARFAWKLTKPFGAIPRLRNSITMSLSKPL